MTEKCHVRVTTMNSIKKRDFYGYILPFLLAVLLCGLNSSAFAQDETSKTKPKEKGASQQGISGMTKRLADALAKMRLKPDAEGKYSLNISSGGYFDPIDRQQLIYSKKATVYMNQGAISKIVFEYYQFSFTNLMRQVKTLINTNPYSEDMAGLQISYSTNTGVNASYKVTDLQSGQTRRDVIEQYSSYLLSLINSLEIYTHNNRDVESAKIERAVQLGK